MQHAEFCDTALLTGYNTTQVPRRASMHQSSVLLVGRTCRGAAEYHRYCKFAKSSLRVRVHIAARFFGIRTNPLKSAHHCVVRNRVDDAILSVYPPSPGSAVTCSCHCSANVRCARWQRHRMLRQHDQRTPFSSLIIQSFLRLSSLVLPTSRKFFPSC